MEKQGVCWVADCCSDNSYKPFQGAKKEFYLSQIFFALLLRICADLAYVCTRRDKTHMPHCEIHIKELGVWFISGIYNTIFYKLHPLSHALKWWLPVHIKWLINKPLFGKQQGSCIQQFCECIRKADFVANTRDVSKIAATKPFHYTNGYIP